MKIYEALFVSLIAAGFFALAILASDDVTQDSIGGAIPAVVGLVAGTTTFVLAYTDEDGICPLHCLCDSLGASPTAYILSSIAIFAICYGVGYSLKMEKAGLVLGGFFGLFFLFLLFKMEKSKKKTEG